jgi:hypothetical protein
MTRPAPRRGIQAQADKAAPHPPPAGPAVGDPQTLGVTPHGQGDEALAELPPDSPEALGPRLSWAWRVAMLVWAVGFTSLLLYELITFAVKTLLRR